MIPAGWTVVDLWCSIYQNRGSGEGSGQHALCWNATGASACENGLVAVRDL